jgi:hypothetical protein
LDILLRCHVWSFSDFSRCFAEHVDFDLRLTVQSGRRAAADRVFPRLLTFSDRSSQVL